MGQNFITPKGTVVGFTALGRPYKDEYTFSVAFDADSGIKDVLAKVEDAETRKNAKVPVKEEDGKIVVRFKRKATTRKGEAWPLTLIDAKKRPMGENASEGSTVRVKFSPFPTEYQGTPYTRFTPTAVQVIDCVLYGGADDAGFDEEDGFESITSPTDVAEETPTESNEAPPQDPGDF